MDIEIIAQKMKDLPCPNLMQMRSSTIQMARESQQ